MEIKTLLMLVGVVLGTARGKVCRNFPRDLIHHPNWNVLKHSWITMPVSTQLVTIEKATEMCREIGMEPLEISHMSFFMTVKKDLILTNVKSLIFGQLNYQVVNETKATLWYEKRRIFGEVTPQTPKKSNVCNFLVLEGNQLNPKQLSCDQLVRPTCQVPRNSSCYHKVRLHHKNITDTWNSVVTTPLRKYSLREYWTPAPYYEDNDSDDLSLAFFEGEKVTTTTEVSTTITNTEVVRSTTNTPNQVEIPRTEVRNLLTTATTTPSNGLLESTESSNKTSLQKDVKDTQAMPWEMILIIVILCIFIFILIIIPLFRTVCKYFTQKPANCGPVVEHIGLQNISININL